MARLSTTSNPTRIIELDRSRVGIEIGYSGSQRHMQVTRLDLAGLELPSDLLVVCIARAGNTTQRFELGAVGSWKNIRYPLTNLDDSPVVRFRILIHRADDPLLVASAENIKPAGADNIESLLPMQPADLGQTIWQLDIDDTDGPILFFNRRVFPNASGVNSFEPFNALVLPEALKQVFGWILEDRQELEDENSVRAAWLPWLKDMGVGLPPDAEGDDEATKAWVKDAVSRFSDRYAFADTLFQQLQSGSEA